MNRFAVARRVAAAIVAGAFLTSAAPAGVLINGSIDLTTVSPTGPSSAGAAEAITTTFADGTFNPGDWTSSTIWAVNAAGIVTSESQQLSGGNPGAYLGSTGSLSSFNGTAVVRIGHFSPNAVYKPQLSGAITSFSGGFHLGSFTNDNRVVFAAGMLIRQNGTLFWPNVNSGYGLQGATGWYGGDQLYTTPPHANPLSWDVVGAPGTVHPNFSATGGPIELGFWTEYYFADAPASVTDGIDNWVVYIGHVPEPAGLFLVSLAPVIGLRSRLRRRSV